MNRSDSISALADALAKAQAQIKNAAKDSENPFFKSSYADLASVIDACRKPLSDHGLAVSQIASSEDGIATVETILMHSSGEWISGSLSLVPIKGDPQGIGSAITYARRYALQAIVCVAAEDDDGNTSSHGNGEKIREQQIDPSQQAEYMQQKATSKQRARLHELAENARIDQTVRDYILDMMEKFTKAKADEVIRRAEMKLNVTQKAPELV